MRRTVSLDRMHDKILTDHSKRLGVSYTEIIKRALEDFNEKEAKREKEIR